MKSKEYFLNLWLKICIRFYQIVIIIDAAGKINISCESQLPYGHNHDEPLVNYNYGITNTNCFNYQTFFTRYQKHNNCEMRLAPDCGYILSNAFWGLIGVIYIYCQMVLTFDWVNIYCQMRLSPKWRYILSNVCWAWLGLYTGKCVLGPDWGYILSNAFITWLLVRDDIAILVLSPHMQFTDPVYIRSL